MTPSVSDIDTPCARICVVHPHLNLCVGCGRTLDEIARWIALSDGERRRIMTQLPARLAAIAGTAAAPATV
jgi:hypothetical protein